MPCMSADGFRSVVKKNDTFQTPFEYIIEFLTELYELGLSYDTLNSARNYLSNLCNKQDGYTLGTHPLVVRFLTGVYNLRPTKPKYQESWDVKKVLCYLKSLSPVDLFTLKLFSYKLGMLIVLTQVIR